MDRAYVDRGYRGHGCSMKWHLQPFWPPDPLYPLIIDLPAGTPQKPTAPRALFARSAGRSGCPLAVIWRVFEDAGIIFFDGDDEGLGVKLWKEQKES